MDTKCLTASLLPSMNVILPFGMICVATIPKTPPWLSGSNPKTLVVAWWNSYGQSFRNPEWCRSPNKARPQNEVTFGGGGTRGGVGTIRGCSTLIPSVRRVTAVPPVNHFRYYPSYMAPLSDYRMPEWYNRLALLWSGVCLGVAAGFLLAMALGGYNAVTFIYAHVVVLLSLVLIVLPSIPKAYIQYRSRMRAFKDGRLQEEMEMKIRSRSEGAANTA